MRPAALNVIMVVAGIAAIVFGSFLVLAPFDVGHFSIDGQTVRGPEFLRRAGIVVAMLTALLAAISVSIARNAKVARALVVLSTGATALASFVLPAMRGTLTWTVLLVLAIWYFYFKSNVVAYYAKLR